MLLITVYHKKNKTATPLCQNCGSYLLERRDYRASKLACTVYTRKISLHPPPAAVDFYPSRTAKHFKLPSNLSFSATQKGHPKGAERFWTQLDACVCFKRTFSAHSRQATRSRSARCGVHHRDVLHQNKTGARCATVLFWRLTLILIQMPPLLKQGGAKSF